MSKFMVCPVQHQSRLCVSCHICLALRSVCQCYDHLTGCCVFVTSRAYFLACVRAYDGGRGGGGGEEGGNSGQFVVVKEKGVDFVC